MVIHNIKIKEKYYNDILYNKKSFELRKNDRNYCVGDSVIFLVLKDNGDSYFSNFTFIITYVLKDVINFGLLKDYCIFSIVKL